MSPLTLLVIADEPQVRRFLRSSLAPTDYKVIESATGEAGLAEAASKPPDVILLDLGLPDLDGIDVTRRLREWSRTPIIILSARGQDQDKIQVLERIETRSESDHVLLVEHGVVESGNDARYARPG